MDQAEGLRELMRQYEEADLICPECGVRFKRQKTNLEYARCSLQQFRDKVFSDEIVRKAEKMSEQYEEAIIDAVEDEQARIKALIEVLDLGGYILDEVQQKDVVNYILEHIFSKG